MRTLILLLVALSLAVPAAAQSTEDRLRAALRRSTSELQTSQASEAALRQELQAVVTERDQLKAARAPREAAGPSQAALAAARAESASLSRNLDAARDALAARDAALAEARSTAAAATANAAQITVREAEREGEAQARAAALTQCQAQRDQLFDIGYELATRFRDRGYRGKAGSTIDPTGLGRPKLEMQLQDYADRLYGVRYPAAPQPAPAGQ